MFLRKIEAVILNKVKDLRLPFYARNFWDTTLTHHFTYSLVHFFTYSLFFHHP